MSTNTPTADAPIAVGRGVDGVVLYVRGRKRPLRLTRAEAISLAEMLTAAASTREDGATVRRLTWSEPVSVPTVLGPADWTQHPFTVTYGDPCEVTFGTGGGDE